MKPFSYFAILALATVALAQQAPPEPKPTPGISVIHFVAPEYPPLAKVARIEGDIRLLVQIAPDGSAKDVAVLSGHPMLREAAVTAVKQWMFGCQRCDQPLTHLVTISFKVNDLGCGWIGREGAEPALPTQVTVRANPVCTDDPAEVLPKKRSLRCLFLFPCSQYRWH